MVLFEVGMYGGHDHDKERVLSTFEFLDSYAQEWYHCHVVSVNHECLHWTFKEVIIELYNWFIQPSTMQDSHKKFLEASGL